MTVGVLFVCLFSLLWFARIDGVSHELGLRGVPDSLASGGLVQVLVSKELDRAVSTPYTGHADPWPDF